MTPDELIAKVMTLDGSPLPGESILAHTDRLFQEAIKEAARLAYEDAAEARISTVCLEINPERQEARDNARRTIQAALRAKAAALKE